MGKSFVGKLCRTHLFFKKIKSSLFAVFYQNLPFLNAICECTLQFAFFSFSFPIFVLEPVLMKIKNGVVAGLYKKGEAAKRLGFKSNTSGYRYIDYLVENDILKAIKLQGIKAPRFRVEDVEALLKTTEDLGYPEFK